jgi:hypothetical protein
MADGKVHDPRVKHPTVEPFPLLAPCVEAMAYRITPHVTNRSVQSDWNRERLTPTNLRNTRAKWLRL